MGSEWPTVPLSNLTAHPATYGIVQPGKHTPDGVPMLRVNNFRDVGFDLGDLSFVSQDVEAKYSRTRLREHDVLLTIVGTIGQVGIVPEDLEGWNIARAVALIRPKDKELSDWIGFVLRSPASLARLNVVANTTVQTTVNLKDLRDLPIPLPTRQVRKVIAAILGSLDDKIEANRKLAKTLEAIASAIFKSWFVDFDPVRAKIAGATSWPSMPQAAFDALPTAFEQTDVGRLPKGWIVRKIEDIANIKGGKQLARNLFVESGSYPIFGGAGRMGRTNVFNANGHVLTVGRVGAYCGKFYWHIGPSWVNNNASLISPQAEIVDFYFLHQHLIFSDVERIKKGAAQPFISNSDILALPVIMPPLRVREVYSKKIRALYSLCALAREENQTLAQTRDTLLPKLISGELRVEEVEEEMEAYA